MPPIPIDAPSRKLTARRVPISVVLVLILSTSVPVATVTALLLTTRSDVVSVVAGVIAGIPSGVFVAWAVYSLQKVQLSVDIVQKATRGNRGAYWVHLRVTNSSPGILGGGTATGVRATLVLDDKPDVTYLMKWDSRPDPIEVQVTSPSSIAVLPNPHLYDISSTETIRGRPKTLGIVFKLPGESNAWIHEPMTFERTDWKVPACRLGPGRHLFSVTLEHDSGEAGPFRFILENQESTEPDTIRLLPDWVHDNPTARNGP
jgi:hypothetical protein